MTDTEYKQLSKKEFAKAAKVYETDKGGVYKMCKKDYPDVLKELESEALMLPVFAYWFWLQITKKTVFPRAFAFTNVLIIFAVLKGVSMFITDAAFSLAFRNGLMSESMIIWFCVRLMIQQF